MSSVGWQRQHQQFYRRRFKDNLTFIKMGLRQLITGLILPEGIGIKEEAQKVMVIVETGLDTIQTFSTELFSQCNHSFMASRKVV